VAAGSGCFFIVFGAAAALVLGPVVGALLILVTDAPFAFLNVVAGIVYYSRCHSSR
jgi:hypothetical protein